jgi:hypothetical protein
VVVAPYPVPTPEVQTFVAENIHGRCFVVIDRYFVMERLPDAVLLALWLD